MKNFFTFVLSLFVFLPSLTFAVDVGLNCPVVYEWNSTGYTFCIGSGFPVPPPGTSGTSAQVGGRTSPGNQTGTLSCVNVDNNQNANTNTTINFIDRGCWKPGNESTHVGGKCNCGTDPNAGGYSITANPNPVQICSPATTGKSHISWTAPAGEVVNVRAGTSLFAASTGSGSQWTTSDGSQSSPGWMTPTGTVTFSLYRGTGVNDNRGGVIVTGTSNNCGTGTGGFCGDSSIQTPNAGGTNEQCDLGSQNGVAGSACSAICRNQTTGPVCGNGTVEPAGGELCDDWNTTSGDGCSSTCENEGSTCGNNVVEEAEGEQCDDGNPSSGDGCSSACQNEISTVYYCSVSGCTGCTSGETCPSGATTYTSQGSCQSQCSVSPPGADIGWNSSYSPTKTVTLSTGQTTTTGDTLHVASYNSGITESSCTINKVSGPGTFTLTPPSDQGIPVNTATTRTVSGLFVGTHGFKYQCLGFGSSIATITVNSAFNTDVDMGWKNNDTTLYEPKLWQVQVGQSTPNLELTRAGFTASQCSLSGSNGSAFGTISGISYTEYSVPTPSSAGTYTYTLNCAGETAVSTLTVQPPATPSVTCDPSPQVLSGTNATINWDGRPLNFNPVCRVNGNLLSGTFGSYIVTVPGSYEFRCTNNEGTIQTATCEVTSPNASGFDCSNNICQACGGSTGVDCLGTGNGCTTVGDECGTTPQQYSCGTGCAACGGASPQPACSGASYQDQASCPVASCGGGSCGDGICSASECGSCVQDCLNSPVCTDGAECVNVTASPNPVVIGRDTSVTISATVLNTGNSIWSNQYKLRKIGGTLPTIAGQISMINPNVIPGQSRIFSITATVPATAGTYSTQWRLEDNAGNVFGDMCPSATLNVPVVLAACVNGANDDGAADGMDCGDPQCNLNGVAGQCCNGQNGRPLWNSETDQCGTTTNHTLTANPQLIRQGGTSQLRWTTGGATGCYLSGPKTPDTFGKYDIDVNSDGTMDGWNITSDGSANVSQIDSKLTYQLYCSSVPRSATISVIKINEI